MLGTVILPCMSRPAFLKICLEYILKADSCEQFQYIFQLDYGYDKRNLDVIKEFPLSKAISAIIYMINGPGKQSNNVLTGLEKAARIGLPVVYIEDDIFIGKDFFTFGLDMIKEPDLLCAILSKNHNSIDNPPENLNGYYVKENHNCYQGLGTIFNPEMFNKYVLSHVVPDYVLRPIQYCKQFFPNTSLGTEFAEQDGLIRRIIEKNKLKVAFSCVPRCFHAGFFGYHRVFAKHIQGMPINKQVEQIKGIAFNIEQLRSIVRQENLVQDSLPVNLMTEHEKVEKIIL